MRSESPTPTLDLNLTLTYNGDTSHHQLGRMFADLSDMLNRVGGDLLVNGKYTSSHPIVGGILTSAAQLAGVAQALQGEGRIAPAIMGMPGGGRA